jgi:hypothetical protein
MNQMNLLLEEQVDIIGVSLGMLLEALVLHKNVVRSVEQISHVNEGQGHYCWQDLRQHHQALG